MDIKQRFNHSFAKSSRVAVAEFVCSFSLLSGSASFLLPSFSSKFFPYSPALLFFSSKKEKKRKKRPYFSSFLLLFRQYVFQQTRSFCCRHHRSCFWHCPPW